MKILQRLVGNAFHVVKWKPGVRASEHEYVSGPFVHRHAADERAKQFLATQADKTRVLVVEVHAEYWRDDGNLRDKGIEP